ncbi:MAG: hypothetical protein ACI8TP_000039 [Acidimicrobiales bacterium]|jgi:hypothetical protein
MFFELRQYQAHPGKRDDLVALMEGEIIPFQISQGMTIVGSFVGEEDPNLYVWIRRFASEEEREALYSTVYQSDRWTKDIGPKIPELMDRDKIVVTRLNATAISALH